MVGGMGRPKAFDRDEVLDRAMELFWQRGYEATSIGDLVDHLGVGRQSLYDTFGDKYALYLEALDHYRDHHGVPGGLDALLAGPVRRAVRDMLAFVIERIMIGKSCMLVAAATERCPSDSEVQTRFGSLFTHFEQALLKRLERARDDGEIGRHHDPAALARYFVNAAHGLQVTGKALRDRAALEQIADVTVSILG
jgi:TetR/AcrR family transcriptional regulator, transcriptional repressor for nem operon